MSQIEIGNGGRGECVLFCFNVAIDEDTSGSRIGLGKWSERCLIQDQSENNYFLKTMPFFEHEATERLAAMEILVCLPALKRECSMDI